MRYNLVLIVFFLSIISFLTVAQSSNYLSYQAVVRNSSGELIVNKEINLKLSILQDSVNGKMAYSEIHQVLTDWKGNVSLKIGEGSVLNGIYTKINWAKTTFFIKTEIDFDGKQNFIFFGASQLISVPYALYAENTLNSLPGPKGLKGDKGDTGEQGATGPMGKINNQKIVLSKNRDSLIFDPLNSIILPDLITHTNRSIGDKSAVSGGTIINAGIPLNSKKGICWSINSLPTINDFTSYAAAASSDFKLSIDRLTSNTIYYVRAFVIHNNSVIYGQVESFKTFKSQFEISYQVVSDNNNDSKINKGEKIYLKVSIKNNGNVALKGVKALFSSIDKYVKNSDSTKLVSFGDISVNSSMDGNGGTSPNNYTYSISFDVSDTTPLNYFIPFNIRIMDANNAVWKASFDLNVVPTNANITYSSHSIAFDNNNDKKVNKGEKIYVQVLLKNIGTSKANGVKASFSTSSKYVTNFEPLVPISYSDINANGTSSGASQLAPNNYQYTIAYTVADTAPNGTKIPIDISMVDESKNKWSTQFELEVVPTNANISYASHSIAYDNNDDKKVNKGEKIYVQVLLKNTGTSKANGVKASFSTSSNYVTNFAPLLPISYDVINANDSASGASQLAPNNYQYTIAYTVADTTPSGTKIPVDISIIDESKNKWSTQFELVVVPTNANISYASHSIAYDNNDDKQVNKGEKIYVQVLLKNTGTSKANGVKASFSTSSKYVTNFEPLLPISYDDIKAYNKSSSGASQLAPNNYQYTISYTVADTTPNGTKIPIDISIIDESKNKWSTQFELVVVPTNANISYASHSIAYDNNDDKQVNKGEKIYVQVLLKNTGISKANGVKASFSTSSNYVTNFEPLLPISYDVINANDSASGASQLAPNNYQYTISYTVADTTPSGTKIPVDISIIDESKNKWSTQFELVVMPTNANISYASHSIAYDNNDDKQVNKGEKIYVQVLLKNTGTSKANGVKASFSTSSKYVTNFEPLLPISYDDIKAYNKSSSGASQLAPNNYQYTISYTVADTTPNGTKIPIDISVIDESKNKWSTQFELEVMQTEANIEFVDYKVVLDENKDSVVNKGEKVYLLVQLKNTGKSKANGLKVFFSSKNQYVSNLEPKSLVSYGDLMPNGVSSGTTQLAPNNYSYTISFDVSNDLPTDFYPDIDLNIIDETKNQWHTNFKCFSLPQVQTTEVTSITKESAVSGGVIISDGGLPIIERGVCLATESNPTTSNSKSFYTSGKSIFISKLTGLKEGVKYFIRAYATNAKGTSYGNQIVFNTSNPISGYGPYIIDTEGNSYLTVFIGSQQWMAENLKVSKYSDGTNIQNITDNTQWKNNITGAFAYYNNDTANNKKFGKLYNWYAVSKTTNGNKNICPIGWHVPTDAEWTALTDYLGGLNIAGGKMKQLGTKDATNKSLFTGLLGGYRYVNGVYNAIGGGGYWWSSSEDEYKAVNVWIRFLYDNIGEAYRYSNDKKDGLSVRCLRD